MDNYSAVLSSEWETYRYGDFYEGLWTPKTATLRATRNQLQWVSYPLNLEVCVDYTNILRFNAIPSPFCLPSDEDIQKYKRTIAARIHKSHYIGGVWNSSAELLCMYVLKCGEAETLPIAIETWSKFHEKLENIVYCYP
ncbi:MAG: hypothetical protein MUO31_07540 [Thermodesulfovibrionales bacterium]|nr:hypothetical protein [Thermodesulfovibrionales bacterium]